jgi:RNA-directed DNA polymerase
VESQRDDANDIDGSRRRSRPSRGRRPEQETRIETQISMNEGDVEMSEEKPNPCSRENGRNPKRVERCGHQTVTVKRENSIHNETSLMEAVLERDNMLEAYRNVMRNKGSPGIDKITVKGLKAYTKENWLRIREELLEGRYRPQPVKSVEIPKPGGGMRKLGIPTVIDRLIQQALHQVLYPIFDPGFSEYSYGFRPGKNAHQAVQKAKEYIAEGREWVVDMDLEKFFDRVNHDILMSRVARKVKDKRVLKLIRGYLQAGIMVEGIEAPREEGTPQGGPLSPLLSNILLDELDKELEARGHKFCRYADDCNIYVKSEKAGRRVMESAKKFLEEKLKLRVNKEKSKVAKPGTRKFLGYTIMRRSGSPIIRISSKAMDRIKDKLRDKIQEGRGKKLETTIKELKPILKGWINYFKLTEVETPLHKLDAWIRRKLRKVIWKQMKRPWTRAKALIKRGVKEDDAWGVAKSRKGPWRCVKAKPVQQAFPNSYFETMGLVSLLEERRKLTKVS